MSTLKFNRAAGSITLTTQAGTTVGSWPAANNAQSGTVRFPEGTWPFAYHKDHPEAPGPDSAYGSYGIFVFTVTPPRPGLGVHSGRAHVPDGRGRKGPGHATNGCIRSTDAATLDILTLMASDPLKTLTVESGVLPSSALIGAKKPRARKQPKSTISVKGQPKKSRVAKKKSPAKSPRALKARAKTKRTTAKR